MKPSRDSRPEGVEGSDPEAPPEALTLEEALAMGQRLHRANRLDQAESIYLQILDCFPEEPNALHFLGVLRFQIGRTRDALNLISQAIVQQPDEPGPLINIAHVLIETEAYGEATEALQRAIAVAPSSLLARNNLGVLHMRCGRFDEAEAQFRRVIAEDVDMADAQYNLATLLWRTGRREECAPHLLRSMASRAGKRSVAARRLLSRVYELEGRHDLALKNLEDWLVECPDDPEAAHYLAAFSGGAVPDRASDAYVTRHFDSFAASFDVALEKVHYQAPSLVGDALGIHLPRLRSTPVVLDAGCGTGLCAPLLRPWASRLDGVDLSAGMLARARRHQLYDELVEAELTSFLEKAKERYDVIVSTDVLIYFGDLGPVVAAAAGALRPGGLLVVSVEAAAEEGRGFRLENHGRYNHSGDYVDAVLVAAGLRRLSRESRLLRLELGEPVTGWIVVATRPAP